MNVIKLKYWMLPFLCLGGGARCFGWGYEHYQRWIFLVKSKVGLDASGLLIGEELVTWPDMRLEMLVGDLSSIRVLSTGQLIPISGLQSVDQFRQEFKALTKDKFETSGYFKESAK